MIPNEKAKKILAEDCFKLKLSDFGKKLLHAIDTETMDSYDFMCNKERGTLKGKSGFFLIKNGNDILRVSYGVNQNKTPKILGLKLQKEKNDHSGMEQNIELEEDIATFGIRPFFTCACGKHATVLYKLPEEYTFRCRTCAQITYESQQLSRYTLKGALYYTHRLIKLAKLQESIKRMFYGGGLSKKGRRFVTLYNHWGSEVNAEARIKAENHLLSVAAEKKSAIREFAQYI